MSDKKGFIEVNVCSDSASPREAPHKRTIALNHIVMLRREALGSAKAKEKDGTMILISEPPPSIGSWVFSGGDVSEKPKYRELLVDEEYQAVQWFVETAQKENRVVSIKDWDDFWENIIKLDKDLKVKKLKFKQN